MDDYKIGRFVRYSASGRSHDERLFRIIDNEYPIIGLQLISEVNRWVIVGKVGQLSRSMTSVFTTAEKKECRIVCRPKYFTDYI